MSETKVLQTFAQFQGTRFALKEEVERVLRGEKDRLAVYKKIGDNAHLSCNNIPVEVDPGAIVIEVLV